MTGSRLRQSSQIRQLRNVPSGSRLHGISLLEVLLVIALIGVVSAFAVVGGRRIVEGQNESAALRSLQQSVWQGATLAASRGERMELVYSNSRLILRQIGATAVIRAYELPHSAGLSIAGVVVGSGQRLIEFTPPGKVSQLSLSSIDGLQMHIDGRVYDVEVSLIGEVRVSD